MEDIIKQLQSLALTEALPYLLKLGGAFVLWFVGRAIIGGFQRVLSMALQKRKLDATLIRYVESLFSGILTILLLLGLLGLMGFETTSFAALLAAAGIAIGSAWAGLLGNFAAGFGSALAGTAAVATGFGAGDAAPAAVVATGAGAPDLPVALVVGAAGSVVAVDGGSARSWPLQAVTTISRARIPRRIGPGYV